MLKDPGKFLAGFLGVKGLKREHFPAILVFVHLSMLCSPGLMFAKGEKKVMASISSWSRLSNVELCHVPVSKLCCFLFRVKYLKASFQGL